MEEHGGREELKFFKTPRRCEAVHSVFFLRVTLW
jgi:hypothetical protein